MAKEFYNKLLLHKAVKLMDSNPFKARLEFEGYLENYPQDYYALVLYVSLLVTLQEFRLAESVLNKVEADIKGFNDSLHKHYFESYFFVRNFLFAKVKLFSYTGRYKEVVDLLSVDSRFCDEFVFFKLYCMNRIGLLSLEKNENTSYIMGQVIDYSEADMRDHISKHLFDSCESSSIFCESSSIFCESFNIDVVLDEIRKYIPSDKKILGGLFDNHYYFRYDGCGRCDNKLSNFIKVVCFDGTSDIITMCPVLIGEDLPYVDLNYLCLDDGKVKKISQIDKFNRRYNR